VPALTFIIRALAALLQEYVAKPAPASILVVLLGQMFNIPDMVGGVGEGLMMMPLPADAVQPFTLVTVTE
jgi:hypothetical protein